MDEFLRRPDVNTVILSVNSKGETMFSVYESVPGTPKSKEHHIMCANVEDGRTKALSRLGAPAIDEDILI